MLEIIDFLSVGEENAKTARELATLLQVNVRDITKQIHRERVEGAVIISTERGFFLPAHSSDVQNFCRIMSSRRRKIARATLSAKKFLKCEEVGENCKK